MALAGIIVFCLMMAVFLVVGLTDARAADFMVLSTISVGFDEIAVDSCFFYLLGGWSGANIDSAQRVTMFTVDPDNWAANDSLARYCIITQGDLDADYNPAGYTVWFLDGREPLRDNAPQITALGISATATVDYDSIAALIAAGAAGSGSEPVILYVIDSTNDAIVPYAKVVVRSADTSSIEGILTATVGGFAAFSLDSLASYPVDVAASGFYMQTAYQLVTVPVGGFTDTLYVYARSFTPPAGGDSCAVVIFTNDAGATAHISIIETDGNQDTSGVALTTHVEVAAADAFGTIQFSLPRTASTRQKTQWRIDVRDGFNKVMLSVPKYTVPNQAIDTLLAPLKNQ